MATVALTNNDVVYVNSKQRVYVRYTINFLLYLTVLNIAEEFWSWVSISSFTMSALAALVLLLGLEFFIGCEAKSTAYWKTKSSAWAKVGRGVSSYLLLVGGKFVIMGIIALLFGSNVNFSGPYAGAVSFIGAVALILITEGLAKKTYIRLGG